MKPEPYLTKLGLKYFDVLEKILQERGMDKDEYSIELSMLAHKYADFHDCVVLQTEKQYQYSKAGWAQAAPWVTRQEQILGSIGKLSAKFGFNPLDFEKIKGQIIEKAEPSELENLMG